MQATTQCESDKQLRDAVQRHLEWEPRIISKDISVSASGGAVTLNGFVHSLAEKFVAERTAKAVYGVRAVANDIEVRLGSGQTDPEIARNAVHALLTDIF